MSIARVTALPSHVLYAPSCSSFSTPQFSRTQTAPKVDKFWTTLFRPRTCFRMISCVVESRWESSPFETINEGVWEYPDSGSESDYDDEDHDNEEEYDVKKWVEDDLDYESDWEKDSDVFASQTGSVPTPNADGPPVDNYEENIIKEVDQLLEPHEREILQQNATPILGKISTARWKPLQSLCLAGQIHLMDKLLEEGVDIDNVDKNGLTALHWAVIGKKEAVISHLLRKGANPHVTDRDGATPLHYAAQVGALQTVKLLIKYKVDVNVADNEGWTPLHVAIQSRNRDTSKVLLINGADKSRKNKDGRTALDLSLCYGKDFKSYDLAKLVKVVPANRDL